ncbi:MAG: DNA polymerase III subunit alpha [Candidatus Peribacter sp.]|jgi:DNA polymerase III subunit alpha|nr:DNA polymerase III subunit alpha [Candidatus Peribacter sp.]MBT4393101.1 DNA polymerase III subunit alpha [Candidatus Peribacter sp.]MBT4600900.1 DNA polymerase III subunit alpha [Candidatus Peribacter sp.]MBT5148970.1 DNA polymerase III subunit alpha [Candidatus Peribacter sp.]MBT5638351.1 DNA polymerase III subunit alpha [Candidatus Peribacter sp.]
MKPEDFVHLHCHSTYSLLEALPRPEEIVLRAKELGQTAVGLADKGFTYGLIELYKAAHKHDIKPILGLEAYCAVRTRHDKESGIDSKRYPLVLLAENQEGYENLLQLATKAALEGMYYKPRVDDELLKEHGKGLIALTGPISGMIPQAALAEDEERIKEFVEKYQSFFGKENFYFELMELPNVTGQIEVNQQLIHWGKELNVPVVATCNSHYCNPDDAEAHDVLLCIQKNAHVDDPSRFSMRDSDFSMRPFEEMEKMFSHAPEALENTRVIADRCEVAFDFDTYHIPKFPTPKKESETDYLRSLCKKGFDVRYPDPTDEHHERMDYELGIIDKMGFSGYFLIVADFVNEAKNRGIIVGPGRGSAAGSLVSYCLGITALDPIEHGLLFERFLNPERVSMPDVDIDFADNRRDEVLEYTREKYGNDRVVQICTFGTLAARAAVKDVGRAYGVPFLEMNSLAKLIPERPGTTLDEALETPELKSAYDTNEIYHKIIDTALKLEGKARHVSVHACGVIITEEPTVHYTSLQRAPKDDETIITQSSAKPLESLGLLKMDFLGLMNLTVIQTTLEIIERTKEEGIDITKIPMDDADTFALLQKGDTTGVFQLESGGMRRYLKQLKPTQFSDIVAMVSLYRPGPMDWIPSYIKRKHGREKIQYIHDDLKPILEPTYGIGVYQEQILLIAQVFAGFSLGQADILRKAIGKKIMSELEAQREKFINGALEKKYPKKLAEKIFDDVITPFAGYGFNKSHAAGYARIAYETAYLKTKYPTEFMAALLSADAQRTDRVMIEIEECRSMGIEVLPPDINQSLRHFTALPEQNAIRFGLTAIKGIGDSSVLQVIEAREQGGKFEGIEDFAARLPVKVLNKKTLEALSKSGALDSLADRSKVVTHYDKIVEFAKSLGDVSSQQTDLFAQMEDSEAAKIEFPETIEASSLEKLQWEKETLGMYVSSHPLAGLGKYIGKKANLTNSLTNKEVGKKITLAGIVEGVKKITTKKGDTMAIVFLEDPTGKIEITLFPRTYALAAEYLEKPDTVIIVGGTLDNRSGQLQLRADAIKKASLTRMIERAKENNFFDEEEAERGLTLTKATIEEEQIEVLDEEGNVIAGETIKIKETEAISEEFLGPLGKWILNGMKIEEALDATVKTLTEKPKLKKKDTEEKKPEGDSRISIHTIDLPDRAPKKMLLDIKSVLETYPGKEKVQLKIGEQTIPLPMTVNMSVVLEKKLQEIQDKYEVAA